MRRKDREVTDMDEIIRIIDECDIVRLGFQDEEYPYIVPMNFAYEIQDGKIVLYVHGAMAGRKYELMEKQGKCCFEMDIPLAMECIPTAGDVTMRYKCVMGTAKVSFVYGEEKQRVVDEVIMGRYENTRNFAYNKAVLPRTMVSKIAVDSVTAKVNPLAGMPD